MTIDSLAEALPSACWSETATFTLIDAWGKRYLHLNRGNLRQKQWQEIAGTVNRRHGHRRTEVQCKNRLDTLKKKFKIEKARVSEFNGGGYDGAWPFFHRLNFLIGDNYPSHRPSPAVRRHREIRPPAKFPEWALPPAGRRSDTQKRQSALLNSYFSRNLSAFAAAAAVVAKEEEGENLNRWKLRNESEKRKRVKESDNEDCETVCKKVALAIERFGEIYTRVEAKKQRQMLELEKQRMQFAIDLEYQRLQLFMETQVQLHKINRSKHSSAPSEAL
ncbi:PREDICTED: trihelix transcription factor ASIL2-like [Lupinus angustifolius]|uniref:trihelix transcription factor ASIL2-like n=1 Tax=Lupinus angustifolius TaxID=3871 RepID=UPI00092EC073|nr:PREDICTED: trihelix transcription factor ASIL2-like [Lupinus angustifolius]